MFGRVRARPGNENDRAALEDVTALFYNEERNEIYTGNNDGRFQQPNVTMSLRVSLSANTTQIIVRTAVGQIYDLLQCDVEVEDKREIVCVCVYRCVLLVWL